MRELEGQVAVVTGGSRGIGRAIALSLADFKVDVAINYLRNRSRAEETARSLAAYLEAIEGVREVIVAGSFRRRKDTVGDLDFLVTASRKSPIMDEFIAYDEVRDVSSKGTGRSTVTVDAAG